MGMAALAIALAVYAMVIEGQRVSAAIMGAIILAVAAGSVLLVTRAVRSLHRQQHATERAARYSERHYFKVLRRIVAAVEARDQYTHGRSKRIGCLCRRIAETLGLPARRCGLLDLAAQVHDIGLLAVPEVILNKPSRLGSEEFRTVKSHADLSYRILQPLGFMKDILPAIHYHHERMNGTGYPHELKGEDIPIEARILAVADAYDAMTHDRPHRQALSPYQALQELRRCTPAGYDEQVVAALEKVMHMGHLQKAHEVEEPLAPAGSR